MVPLPVHKVGHKVITPLTLPPLPVPLHSWELPQGLPLEDFSLRHQSTQELGKGPRLCPVVAAAVTAIVLLPVSC